MMLPPPCFTLDVASCGWKFTVVFIFGRTKKKSAVIVIPHIISSNYDCFQCATFLYLLLTGAFVQLHNLSSFVTSAFMEGNSKSWNTFQLILIQQVADESKTNAEMESKGAFIKL